MQAQSRMKLWRAGPVNSFLLCTVLAEQTRRLGRLMPDSRIPELITIALKNCADYELALDVDAGVPEVVREEAMQIGRLTRRPEPVVVSSPERFERSEIADAVSASGGQGATEGVAAAEVSLLARVQLALIFLWAAVSILLIFAVIYIVFKIVFKGNIR